MGVGREYLSLGFQHDSKTDPPYSHSVVDCGEGCKLFIVTNV